MQDSPPATISGLSAPEKAYRGGHNTPLYATKENMKTNATEKSLTWAQERLRELYSSPENAEQCVQYFARIALGLAFDIASFHLREKADFLKDAPVTDMDEASIQGISNFIFNRAALELESMRQELIPEDRALQAIWQMQLADLMSNVCRSRKNLLEYNNGGKVSEL